MQKFTSYFGCGSGCVLEVFGVVVPLLKKDLSSFCSLFTVHWWAWNSPCKVAMSSRAVLHSFLLCILPFTYNDGYANTLHWLSSFPDINLIKLPCFWDYDMPHFAFVAYVQLSWWMRQTLVSLPVLKRILIVWALLMCCYWDQCRHDSWASASMFTLGCGLIPPVNSLLSARGETLTAGVMFIRKYVTCQDLVWPVTLE